MILLDYHNVVIEETLNQPIVNLEPTVLDMTVVDFDGVAYHLSTPESKSVIKFSLIMQCYKELVQWGAQDMLQREYGPYCVPKEDGYDVTLEFDLQKLPEDKSQREELVKKLALIKRNLMAQPFERAFEQQAQFEDEKQPNPTPDLMQIGPQLDRVTVIFTTLFKEETDRIFGRVFLQEFVDARRRPAIQNAPQVLYSSKEPPLEIRHLPELQNTSENEDIGYVTFVLFPRHFAKGDAYMHSRMRARVQEFLKVLNRAKPEVQNVEKKTITGKTVIRS
ncbi:unnamed protein product [Rhizophagus irregularis]|nr:unnamed protein product [Rhizophagus irregularis]